MGKHKCKGKGGKSESTTKRKQAGLYLLQGQSEGRVGARNPNVIEIAEKRHLEESTSQEPEAGGNVEMCRHVLPKLTWGAGCITMSSWTTIKHIKL